MRLSVRSLTSFIALAAFAASANHAAPPNLVTGGMGWLLNAQPIDLQATGSRAKLGEFLFAQPLVPAAEAVPEAGQVGLFPEGFGKKTTVPLDDLRFALTVGGVDGSTYCAIEGTKSATQRLCLIDLDDDGTFDYQGRAFGLGNGAPFARMLLAANVVPAIIKYSKKKAREDALMHGGMVISKKGNSFTARFAVQENGKPKALDLFSPEHRFLQQRRASNERLTFTPEQLPATVKLYGATLEIVAIAGNEVAYRLVSAFDPTEAIVVARAGKLPMPR